MTFTLTARDRARLDGVHPDLVGVIERAARLAAAAGRPFMVIEGVRTLARQRELVARGASRTMNSRHLVADNGFAHAVDIAPLDPATGQVSWDWPLYYPLADLVKQAAREEGVPVEWGGDWSRFKDGPHWQLPWRDYPGGAPAAAGDAPITEKSESRATAERVGTGTVGVGLGVGVAAEPAAELINAVQGQQNELASGDLVRLAIAAAIIGITLWLAVRRARA